MALSDRNPAAKSGESPDSNPAEKFEVRVPKYRRHKKIYARVVLGGREVYLGLYGTPESKANYEREVAEWLQSGRKTPKLKRRTASIDSGQPSMTEIIVKYVEFADEYYRRPDGTPTREADNVRDALRPLRRLFGNQPAEALSPANLKTFQAQLVRDGLSRSTVNKRVNIVRRMMKWAARESLIPASVAVELNVVDGLRRGRTKAKETEPVRPVPEADILAIKEFVSPVVWSMVQVQVLSGMRPSEVCRLRTCDIDRREKIWKYEPPRHKTEHHGKQRIVFLGPRAQTALIPWLSDDQPEQPIFSPAQAVELHRAALRKARKSKIQPSQRDRSKLDPKIKPGKCYQVGSYCRAVERACVKAGVSVWSPNRLRHTAATNLRKEFGIEVARAVLGHSTVATTEIYAERDESQARLAMERSG